jgi:hypothetical protein
MLVDISRNPVRVIFEICPGTVVVRSSSSVKGQGYIHHDKVSYWDRPSNSIIIEDHLKPVAHVPQNGLDHYETLLRYDREGLYSISKHVDQMTKKSGVWRIHFLLDDIKKGKLLTLMDETRSVVLFTLQLDEEHIKGKNKAPKTPLQKFMYEGDAPKTAKGVWGVLRAGGDFDV